MMEVAVKTADGKDAGSVSVDEDALGGMVKRRLMHAAVVMHQANRRQGSACTKTRAEIAGSTKKLYRQKGTGRARAGTRKSGIRVGGGRIFGPKPRDFGWAMPRKQRRAAVKSALLAKLKDGEVLVVDGFGISEVGTKHVVALLDRLGLKGEKVMLAPAEHNPTVYLSGRNIRRVAVKAASDLNTHDLLNFNKLVIEKAGFETLLKQLGAVESSEAPESSGAGDDQAGDKDETEAE